MNGEAGVGHEHGGGAAGKVGGAFEFLLLRLPGVAKPIQRRSFKEKMKWTGIMLLSYFALGQIPVWGISQVGLSRFRELEALLGASFGSIVTLGIGPIVTASIILQLVVGSKIWNIDLNDTHGRIIFQGTQKLLAFLFTVIEAMAYTLFGALQPASFAPTILLAIIAQLTIGGWLIIFMDEVVSKWGFGSGVSLFIVASVAKQIFISAFSFEMIGQFPAGRVLGFISSIAQGAPEWSFLLPIISTVAVFAIVVYAQAMRVEIPLAFGAFRGFGRKWPLRFIYTSNIPVILTAALAINLRIWAQLAGQRGASWLGQVNSQGNVVGGLVYFLTPPNFVGIQVFSLILFLAVIAGFIIAYYAFKEKPIQVVAAFGVIGTAAAFYVTNSFYGMPPVIEAVRAVTYMLFFIFASVMFAIFWVNTAGMDAHSVANQIQRAGLQIPGFRRDPRIIEHVLNRYIPPLTVLGSAFVGFLAAFANFTDALAAGTSILLAVMIVYQLYEELAYQHLEDMHPILRKFIERG